MSYINLAKRLLNEHGEVHFAALGVAISPMVTAAEILKNRRLATVSRITTSLETLPDDQRYVVCHEDKKKLPPMPPLPWQAALPSAVCWCVHVARMWKVLPMLIPLCSTGKGRSPRWRSSCTSQLILTRL
jgi:hypothetical protein